MDAQRAIAVLGTLIDLLDRHDAIADRHRDSDYPYWRDPDYLALKAEIRGRLPGVERIAAAVDKAAARTIEENEVQSYASEFQSVREGVERVIGALRGQEEIEEILGPTGPKLAATQLHRWVWEPASTRWDAGQRRDAIQAAATNVFDNHLAAKLGRPADAKGGRDLAGLAFNLKDPEQGTPRLRLPGYTSGDKDWINAHEGAMELGQACAQLVRNLTTHDLTEPTEDHALEQLAVLSLFARLVEGAVVLSAP